MILRRVSRRDAKAQRTQNKVKRDFLVKDFRNFSRGGAEDAE